MTGREAPKRYEISEQINGGGDGASHALGKPRIFDHRPFQQHAPIPVERGRDGDFRSVIGVLSATIGTALMASIVAH